MSSDICKKSPVDGATIGDAEMNSTSGYTALPFCLMLAVVEA